MRTQHFAFIFFFTLILSVQFVSAYYLPPVREVVERVVQAFVDIFEPILQALFGRDGWNSYLLFEKLLLFIVLLGLVYIAIGWIPAFEDNKAVKWIIAIVIPLLGIRFLETGWLLAIMLQYQVLAIVLSSILPFIIYFFFLHNVSGDSSVIRKIGWIFFIVVYLGLWATVQNETYSTIYFWTMVVSLLFLLADQTIHRYYINQEMKRADSANKWEHTAKLRRDISDIQHDMGINIPERIAKRLIKKKQRKIEWFMKHG